MKYQLWWISEDRDSSIKLDCYGTKEDAEKWVGAWWDELIDQCESDEEYRDIQRGDIEIEEVSEC